MSRAAAAGRRLWITAGAFVFMSLAVASMAERVYLGYGENYPRWLADGELRDVDATVLARLRETDCRKDIIEIYRKKDSVVLRCGLLWIQPSTKTFIAKSFELQKVTAHLSMEAFSR
jgi:hypothetical protein